MTQPDREREARAVESDEAKAHKLMVIDGYKRSKDSRPLLIAIIRWLDLDEKDPESWAGLETILATVLLQAQRAAYEEIAKELETYPNRVLYGGETIMVLDERAAAIRQRGSQLK